jgi:hypothetical protein
MEVHAHTHTARKKWTHYFWEFFMLFLAVFAGFLAENQREHFVEHQREKQYAQSLYSDLKLDTGRLGFIRSIKLWKGKKLDSLKIILTGDSLREKTNYVYYYSLFVNFNHKFYTQDATIQQLRNAGTLRYFKGIQLYNSIASYYKMCSFYLDREVEQENQVAYPTELIAKIFDTRILMENFYVKPNIWDNAVMPGGNPQLLSTDKQLINHYYLFISNKKWGNDVSLLFLNYIEENAKSLMTLLKKEYSVE